MDRTAIDNLPGFRRRFRITPSSGVVSAEVEDDFHCMSVTVRHQDGVTTALEPVLSRAPWTTCPGAVDRLKQTFGDVPLAMYVERGEKRENCTHLHDLATLAAAHAFDAEQIVYDIVVSDPVEGLRHTEIRRNGRAVLRWTIADGRIVEPPELVGLTLDRLSRWISSLEPPQQEAARLLRWGTMIANGRQIPLQRQSDAGRMPTGNCYTFQADRKIHAQRIVAIRDFSRGAAQPLALEPQSIGERP